MIHYIQFIYEEEHHLAFGETELSMPVYYRSEGATEYRRRGQLRFPSWLKFVPGDEFTLVSEGEAQTEAEMLAKLKIKLIPEENAKAY